MWCDGVEICQSQGKEQKACPAGERSNFGGPLASVARSACGTASSDKASNRAVGGGEPDPPGLVEALVAQTGPGRTPKHVNRDIEAVFEGFADELTIGQSSNRRADSVSAGLRAERSSTGTVPGVGVHTPPTQAAGGINDKRGSTNRAPFAWRPQGDLNPCRRRERPVSLPG